MCDARFVRVAGIAGVIGGVAAIVINFALMDPPPGAGASLADILAYLNDRTGSMRIGNGLRMAVFVTLPVFAVGVYTWIGPSGSGWRRVGMLGTAMVPAVGIVANSAETIAFWRLETLGEQPELLTMLWSFSTVLFNAAMVLWAVGITGFSLAGRAAGSMPKWLWTLGLVAGAFGVATGGGISLVVTLGWAEGLAFVGFVLIIVWVWATSILLLRANRPA